MSNLIFKPLSVEYLEWARLLHNDPDVICMLTDPHLVTKEEQVVWFDNLSKSNSSERVLVFDNLSNPVGLIRIDGIDNYNKCVCVGLDIHKDFRGRGLAKQVYHYVFNEWFINKGFNRIWLLVAEYNSVARHIYEKLGFIYEGAKRKSLYKNGVFYDYMMMGLLKDEYLAQKNKNK
jgi:RimJ/RimL family protein N-acetyltransferase